MNSDAPEAMFVIHQVAFYVMKIMTLKQFDFTKLTEISLVKITALKKRQKKTENLILNFGFVRSHHLKQALNHVTSRDRYNLLQLSKSHIRMKYQKRISISRNAIEKHTLIGGAWSNESNFLMASTPNF